MTLVAAVVETSTCASSPRALTAPDRSGSQVTAASTFLALNTAAASGASVVKTMFFSIALPVVGGQARLRRAGRAAASATA